MFKLRAKTLTYRYSLIYKLITPFPHIEYLYKTTQSFVFNNTIGSLLRGSFLWSNQYAEAD